MGSLVRTLTTLLVVSSIVAVSVSEPVEDKKALLEFISGIPHKTLNWNASMSLCTAWNGVSCDRNQSRIVAVHLPGVSLNGRIPPNTLSRLSGLQILSLRSNGLDGPFPEDFSNLTALTGLHVQSNSFSGPLKFDFAAAWSNLTALNLSFNSFNGTIPDSISKLSSLITLDLSNNSFTGGIPDFRLPNLKILNLANNKLEGVVPESLRRFPHSAFSGNLLSPLPPSPPPAPSPVASEPHGSRRIWNESVILGIIVGGCALGFVAIAMLMILCFTKRKQNGSIAGKIGKGGRSPEKAISAIQDGDSQLMFFEGCVFDFDLEDLLRASAEVLGKGMFGTTYKAALEDSTMVVVKRLKDVGVGRREFEQQMDVVGRIKHENVVELRAYYYSKDEKLIVYDYHSLGSVCAMLHGNRGEDRTPLDWESRLKIAVGTARGIAHIHTQNGGKLVHGNIKSSNVFLNHHLHGCISDTGLSTLMNPMISPISRSAGYRAPEISDVRKATQVSDVYSFGVLLLELLTGRSPIQVIGGGDEIIHLVRWVQSVVREEWTAEVFDLELMRYPNIEEEMVEMLQIAMSCVVRVPDRRPKITDVVKLIQGVRKLYTGNRTSSEAISEDSGTPTPQQGQASSSYAS